MFKPLLLVVATFGLAVPATAQNDAPPTRIQFARGTSSKAIPGAVRGYDGKRYVIGARAGQRLTVTLRTSNASNYFNVTAPGASAAMEGGANQTRFTTTIPSSGDYVIDVYLMRNAARRNESAKYTLTVGIR